MPKTNKSSKREETEPEVTEKDQTDEPEVRKASKAKSKNTKDIKETKSSKSSKSKNTSKDGSDASVTKTKSKIEDKYEDAAALYNPILVQLKQLGTDISSIRTNIKTAAKRYDRLRKEKGNKRRANRDAEPSGIVAPAQVPQSLIDLLELKKGVEMPRTQVTKLIHKYMKSNNLVDSKDARTFHPDKALRKALNMSKSDELTFFNLQTKLKEVYNEAFPKKAAATKSGKKETRKSKKNLTEKDETEVDKDETEAADEDDEEEEEKPRKSSKRSARA